MRMHADYRSLATLALSAYAALSSLGCTPGAAASSSIPQSLGSQAIPANAARVMVSGLVAKPLERDERPWTDAAPDVFGAKIGRDERHNLVVYSTGVRTPSGAVYPVEFPVESSGGPKVGFSGKYISNLERQINGPDLFGPDVSDMPKVYEKFEKRPVCLAVETVGGTAVAAPRIAELANAKDYLGKLSADYMQKVAGAYMQSLGLKGKVTDLPPPVICDLYFAATAQPTPTPSPTPQPQAQQPAAAGTPQAGQPQGGIIDQAQQKIEDAKKELEKLMQQAQQPGAAAPAVATPEPVPPTPAPTPVPAGTKTDNGAVTDYNAHLTGGLFGVAQSNTIDFKVAGLELRVVQGERGFGEDEYNAAKAFLQQAQADGSCVKVNYDKGPTPKPVTSPQALTLCQ